MREPAIRSEEDTTRVGKGGLGEKKKAKERAFLGKLPFLFMVKEGRRENLDSEAC